MTKISSIQIFLEGGASRSNDDFSGSYRINAHMPGEYEEGKAQLARLIDAAPALLEALEGIIWKLDRCETLDNINFTNAKIDKKDAIISIARAALKQAKGE